MTRLLKIFLIPVIDLADDFPPPAEYFYDDCRFTLRSSELVAQRITSHPALENPQRSTAGIGS